MDGKLAKRKVHTPVNFAGTDGIVKSYNDRVAKGREPVKDYNTIQWDDSEDEKQAKLEFWIAKKIGEHLTTKYKGWSWGVGVDVFGGVVKVFCDTLHVKRQVLLHLESKTIHQLCKEAEKAAGEILERFYQPRKKLYVPDYYAMERDIAGDVKKFDDAT